MKISARTGEGLEELTEILETILRGRKIFLEKLYTYKDAGKIQTIRKFGQLLSEEVTGMTGSWSRHMCLQSFTPDLWLRPEYMEI